jgi:RHS repeat-associated protein
MILKLLIEHTTFCLFAIELSRKKGVVGLLTNQLTYRGYFYDFETGLYYLQSRYDAPNWGRFVNADKHFDTGDGILGTNMYIYCLDNPISYTDPNGEGLITGMTDFDEQV